MSHKLGKVFEDSYSTRCGLIFRQASPLEPKYWKKDTYKTWKRVDCIACFRAALTQLHRESRMVIQKVKTERNWLKKEIYRLKEKQL